MTLNCEKLWNKVKKDLLPHQVEETEHYIHANESFEICWICGTPEEVHYGKMLNDEGLIVDFLFCPACFTMVAEVVYTKETKVMDIAPLEWALECERDVEMYQEEWEKYKEMRQLEEGEACERDVLNCPVEWEIDKEMRQEDARKKRAVEKWFCPQKDEYTGKE